MLSKNECFKAYNALKKALFVTIYDEDRFPVSCEPVYVEEMNIFEQLIDEYFALVELFGLDKEYEKVGIEDKEELKKLIEDNRKLWEQTAKDFNEEKIKYLQDQIELLEKEKLVYYMMIEIDKELNKGE